jgi:hypothetical protein
LGGLFVDLGGGPEDALLLAGAHRSGTTWIANVANYDGRYRPMYEPFNAWRVPFAKPFPYGLYIRPSDRDETRTSTARAILSGRVRHVAVDRGRGRLAYRKRLIKETYANLFLGWLRDLFPALPIVLLLRHPCAVAASRIQLGWASMLGSLLVQPQLVEDHLAPLVDRIVPRDTFEEHVFNWCIQYYVPLRQFARGSIHLAFYEELCVDPRGEIGRMFSYLGEKFDEGVFEALSTPSMSAGKESAVRIGSANLVEAWRKKVTPDQARQAIEILKIFGLDAIYSDDSMPSRDGALA